MIRFWCSLCLLMISLTASLQAQPPKVLLGPAFNEPGDGWDKLLLLKNGHTFYLHFTRKTGIEITVYNPKREIAAVDTIKGEGWDARNMGETEVDAVYEINGQVVVFLQQLIKFQPTLFRIILDGETGKLVKEDRLGALPSILQKDAFALNNLASHDCFVEKDPSSDYYAVALFAGGEIQRNENTNERIKLLHFSPDHQLINQAYYYLPDSTFSYFTYLGMSVQGKEQVFLTTTGFNKRNKTSEASSKVIISALQAKDSSFLHQPLNYTAGTGNVKASMQYLSVQHILRLLLITPAGKGRKEDGYNVFLNDIQADVCKLKEYHSLQWEKVSAYGKKHLAYEKPYMGLPQEWQLHPDGSSTLLLENLSQFTQGHSQYSKFHTNLGDIGICQLDTAGIETEGSMIAKAQVVNGICEPFYLQRKAKGEWSFRNKIQALNTNTYLSFEYLKGPQATFVLFNDYLQYLEKGGAEKARKPLKYANDANLVCYRFENGHMQQTFPFGTPEADKGYYCMLGASDYAAQENIYATVMISRTGTEKKAYIAWIQL
jgi:hypothetical protein